MSAVTVLANLYSDYTTTRAAYDKAAMPWNQDTLGYATASAVAIWCKFSVATG